MYTIHKDCIDMLRNNPEAVEVSVDILQNQKIRKIE